MVVHTQQREEAISLADLKVPNFSEAVMDDLCDKIREWGQTHPAEIDSVLLVVRPSPGAKLILDIGIVKNQTREDEVLSQSVRKLDLDVGRDYPEVSAQFYEVPSIATDAMKFILEASQCGHDYIEKFREIPICDIQD